MDYIPPPNGDTEDPDRPWLDANPGAGVEGSKIIAQFFNDLQAEMLGVIDAGGIERDGEDLTQMAQAILAMIASNTTGPMDMAFMAGVSSDGAGQDLDVQEYGRQILGRDIVISDFYANAAVAPTGAALIMDITINGSTIFDTKPQISAAANNHTAGVFLDDAESIAAEAGDVLVFTVTQIGSSVAGQKLTATVVANAA